MVIINFFHSNVILSEMVQVISQNHCNWPIWTISARSMVQGHHHEVQSADVLGKLSNSNI